VFRSRTRVVCVSPLLACPECPLHLAGAVDKNDQAVSTLSTLPSPFLSLDDKVAVVLPSSNFQRWETQRGCAFRCTFCQHRGTSQSVTTVKDSRVEAELRFLADTKTLKVNIVDPTFNHNQVNAISVLNRIHACALSLQTRPEKVTSSFLDAVQDSEADITLECGVQTFEPSELKLIGRMPGTSSEATVKKVDKKLADIKERGIRFEVSLIYGLPHQTVDSFMRSLEKAHLSGADKVSAFPLMLLRGTELHARRHELGLREDFLQSAVTSRIQDFIPHVVETPALSTIEWIRLGEIAAALEK